MSARALPQQKDRAKKYAVSISIVLIGVLILYLLFIVIQIKSLFVGSLPTDFGTTERLVKTGFWQLFLLTLINITCYVGVFNKSSKMNQRVLAVFTVASLLLIFSAAYKTYLYVVTYGLSYEKFYALYTVLFCMGVFGWFLFLFVHKSQEAHIIRNLAFAALWMYALTTVVPLERVIFSTNLSLTQDPDSRINIVELRMLGFDSVPFVEKHFDELVKESKKDNIAFDAAHGQRNYEDIWQKWRAFQLERMESRDARVEVSSGAYLISQLPKTWYEKTVNELFYRSNLSPQ